MQHLHLLDHRQLPTLITICPPLPAVALPVVRLTNPLVPELVVPDLNVKYPLTPFTPASTLAITRAPLDLAVPLPAMEIMEELHKRSNKPQTLEVSHLEQLGSETVENVTLFGDDLCVICQDIFEEGQVIRRLDCGHTFHKDCIDPYLTNYKMECPTDRKKVMVPEVEKITVEKKKTLLQQEEEPAQSTVEDAKVAEVIIGLQNMGIPVPNRAMILSELAMMGGNAIMTIQYFVNQVLGGGQDY